MSDAIHGGIIVDIAQESFERVDKLLAGVKNGARTAVGSALKRAASSGKTEAGRALTRHYSISSSEIKRNTNNINHFKRDSSGGLSVVFGFRGHVIPLLKFDTTITKDGLVKTKVKKNGAQQTLDHAFLADMNGHHGVYQREGPGRLPVKELFGPSTTQMMYSNEAVLDEVEKRMVETYQVRIDHEMNRLLNGWGR